MCVFDLCTLLVFLFVSEMAAAAAGALLASLLFLSTSVPCFSVYNSGECFFNTKGILHVCLSEPVCGYNVSIRGFYVHVHCSIESFSTLCLCFIFLFITYAIYL